MNKKILKLLENNSKLSVQQIAVMLKLSEEEVQQQITQMEQDGTIINYHTMINWEKTGDDSVLALIEVKITPQRNVGYDAVARRIYQYDEVKSVQLMSGAYDLVVFVEGKNIKEVAHFVGTKLATLDNVLSVATHFVLKTYKQEGILLENENADTRLVVSP